jgi:AhpD family alkylhydroperoxidase
LQSKKDKEIIAVAITHVTQCPYCIEAHTKAAKKAGATPEDLAEAVFVTAAVEAGGTVTHIVFMYTMQKIKKHQMYFMLVLI